MSSKIIQFGLLLCLIFPAACTPASPVTPQPEDVSAEPLGVFLSPDTRWLGEYLNACADQYPAGPVLVISEGEESQQPVIRFLLGETGAHAAESYLIHREAVRVVVGAGSPVETLTGEQLEGIFSGRYAAWGEISPDYSHLEAITIVDFPTSFGMHQAAGQLGLSSGVKTLAMPSSEAVIEQLSSNPAVLGYLLSRDVTSSVKTVSVEPNREISLPIRAESAESLSSGAAAFLACVQEAVQRPNP